MVVPGFPLCILCVNPWGDLGVKVRENLGFPHGGGGCIPGKIKIHAPILLLCGQLSHEMAVLFQKTVFPPVIDQEKKEPSHGG